MASGIIRITASASQQAFIFYNETDVQYMAILPKEITLIQFDYLAEEIAFNCAGTTSQTITMANTELDTFDELVDSINSLIL